MEELAYVIGSGYNLRTLSTERINFSGASLEDTPSDAKGRPSLGVVTTPLLSMARSFRIKGPRPSAANRKYLRIGEAELAQLRRRYRTGSGAELSSQP